MIIVGRQIACFTIIVLIVAPPAHAEEKHDPESEMNVISLFAGFASQNRREGATLGIDYVRRLNESFGIGIGAERSFGDFKTNVFTLPFSYRVNRWKAWIAPGIEDSPTDNHGLIRVGSEYSFEAGDWEISPQLNVDFLDGDQVVVLGFAFGYPF